MKIDELNNNHITRKKAKYFVEFPMVSYSGMKSTSDTPTTCQVRNWKNRFWNSRNTMKR